MAHSSDRTLLTQLGFADPDRKNERHDRAIQYLAQGEMMKRMVEVCGVVPVSTVKNARVAQRRLTPEFERPVVKGSGDYRMIVGFLDLTLWMHVDWEEDREEQHYDRRTRQDLVTTSTEQWTMSEAIVIEVKITPVSIGEVLRQLNLYREFFIARLARAWVLATDYPISEGDRIVLKASKIWHVRLGSGFDEYLARKDEPAASPEL
jgi:hypothetical protein